MILWLTITVLDKSNRYAIAQIGDTLTATYTLTAGDNYEFDTTAITTSSSVTGGTLNGGTITIDSVTAEEIEITLTYSTIS